MFDIERAKQMEKATGHSYCSPSQLYRIILCPGSLGEATKAPIQPPSQYANEGTRKHGLTFKLLDTGSKAVLAGEIEEVRQEILACQDYVKDLEKCKRKQIGRWWNEKVVDLSPWGFPDIWGTSDFGYLWNDGRVDVIDWKFGSGVTVYAKDNAQLMTYAAGAIGYPDDKNLTIHLHIVQPPVNHFDEYVISFTDLEKWVFETLEPALITAKEPNPPFKAGEYQCKFCPASMTCKFRYQDAVKKAKEVFGVYKQDLSTVNKTQLANIMEKINDIKSYASQIAIFATNELAAGKDFPGYKLVSGRSNRSWVDEDKTLDWLKGNSSIAEDQLHKKKLVSPAQAEALDRHLKKDSTFENLYHKPQGKPQLVTVDDPRKALKPSSVAAEVFKDSV